MVGMGRSPSTKRRSMQRFANPSHHRAAPPTPTPRPQASRASSPSPLHVSARAVTPTGRPATTRPRCATGATTQPATRGSPRRSRSSPPPAIRFRPSSTATGTTRRHRSSPSVERVPLVPKKRWSLRFGRGSRKLVTAPRSSRTPAARTTAFALRSPNPVTPRCVFGRRASTSAPIRSTPRGRCTKALTTLAVVRRARVAPRTAFATRPSSPCGTGRPASSPPREWSVRTGNATPPVRRRPPAPRASTAVVPRRSASRATPRPQAKRSAPSRSRSAASIASSS